MKKSHFQLDAYYLMSLTVLLLCFGVWALTSCKDDNGLTEGDANYFTGSRGQFTATLNDGTTLYLLSGGGSNATLTYDGNNPRHWQSETTATVSVTTYTGDLDLTQSVNGGQYTLTRIGEEAMMGCRTLTSVTLPATVQSFGEGAFAICNALTTVNIPDGVAEIPTGCFGYCQKLNNVVLPSTVRTIAKMGFFGCSGLKNITLSDGLTTIGERAFFDCSSLTAITIPATVTTIGNRAFGGRDASSRSKIAAYYVKATTPPVLQGVLYEAQDGVNPVIYVPTGCVAAYQAAAGWSSLTIEEE